MYAKLRLEMILYRYPCCKLALLPITYIPEAHLNLVEQIPDSECYVEFHQYISNVWINKITTSVF